jgi:polysaccharide deacetylase family protein (PEP-CTERM system associated)
MPNILTIDLEDYCSIFSRDWLKQEIEPTEAVVKNTRWYLDIFNKYNTKATFFILGEVAQKFPCLIKEIANAGHEMAVHGFYHRQVFKLNQEEFRQEVGSTKKLLEDLSGQQAIGYRAPAFSINNDTKWALEVLAELGFIYDSSVSPMAGKRYGWPGFKKEIHTMDLPDGQSIIEVPMSTISLGIKSLGVGGGYFRHFLYLYTKLAVSHIQKERPTIFYMHPYEIDTEVRKYDFKGLNFKDRFKAYKFHFMQLRNRKTIKLKVFKLLEDFEFVSIESTLRRYAKQGSLEYKGLWVYE